MTGFGGPASGWGSFITFQRIGKSRLLRDPQQQLGARRSVTFECLSLWVLVRGAS